MVGDLEILSGLRDVPNCPVGMPNGNKAIATKEGTIDLNGNISLKNVLYVPGLNCNPISVSQIINDLDSIVQFTKQLCVMKGPVTRMLIGAGERKDGLHCFRNLPQIKAMKVDRSNSLDLWHKQLGHPCLKITKLLPLIDSRKISILDDHCDVCLGAKQTRNKFPLSENKASDMFKLIHCDLWGT